MHLFCVCWGCLKGYSEELRSPDLGTTPSPAGPPDTRSQRTEGSAHWGKLLFLRTAELIKGWISFTMNIWSRVHQTIPYLLFALIDMGLFPFLKEARIQWFQSHRLDETEVYFKKPGSQKPCRTAFFYLTRRRRADTERKERERERREIIGSKNFTFSEVHVTFKGTSKSLSKEHISSWINLLVKQQKLVKIVLTEQSKQWPWEQLWR